MYVTVVAQNTILYQRKRLDGLITCQLQLSQASWDTSTVELQKYSRTSMARTLMARLPRLFRTRYWVPWNKSHSCRFWDNVG